MLVSILIAVILDFLIGDPYSFPHPVKLMGNIINFEEKQVRRITKTKVGLQIGGLLIVFINISIGFIFPFMLLKWIKDYKILYNIINIYLIYTCLAARSLHYEAEMVSRELKKGIEAGRNRVKYIVGRDTSNLGEKEIIKATVETVAENTSDGVIGPLMFIIFLGAPGGFLYKFVNTMDSMLGYMDEKYIDIGYFPAKLDDLFNLIPARITALLMQVGSIGRFNVKNGFKIMIRDRKNHKSPNAVYPEATVAGLLGIQLGGDNYYHGVLVKKPSIGDQIYPLDYKTISNTVEIMYRSELLLIAIYTLIYYMIL